MEQDKINKMLEKHKKWLNNEEGGERAVLSSADLRGAVLSSADLRGADLRYANLSSADLSRAVLRGADLSSADLRGAVLRRADLRGAVLRRADLRGADLDYSVLPLWCGSFDMKVDARIAAQIAYHFCRLDCEDAEYIKARNAIVDFANTFHRVKECGKLKKRKKER